MLPTSVSSNSFIQAVKYRRVTTEGLQVESSGKIMVELIFLIFNYIAGLTILICVFKWNENNFVYKH